MHSVSVRVSKEVSDMSAGNSALDIMAGFSISHALGSVRRTVQSLHGRP